MLENTVFDLASLTKITATAPLAATLVDRGWLSWDTPVAALLPEYLYKNIKIRHLLSHTAGLVAWRPFWQEIWKQFEPTRLDRIAIAERQKVMRDLVLSVAPEAPPGEKCLYSDLSFLILGFALEKVTGLPLYQAVKKWVWQPMGLEGPHFRLTCWKEEADRVNLQCAATEKCTYRGRLLQGEVHDENCWAMGGYGGHAGVFACAQDVLRYARGLFQGFLSPKILNEMWTRVSEPVGCERTLGWDTPSATSSSVGSHFSKKTVGHLGFTGTSLWIDIEAELAVTLLSARVHPSRDNNKIRELRPQLYEAIRLDLKF
jgi:CubicO group peptidase (beta-lactamase class C family)